MSDWRDWIKDERLQQLIQLHESEDVASLALQWSRQGTLPQQWLLQQIEGRQKARIKLPDWYATPGIVYPDRTALEQASSELTAAYKQQFVKGKRVADLTGGLGVDSASLAFTASEVLYCEPDPLRFELAKHNFSVLGRKNITCVNVTAENAVEHLQTFKPDIIYIDPSRRSNGNRKFRFEDLQPDVLPLLPQWLQLSSQVVVKAAPMLDIKMGIRQLEKVQEVHVLSVKNECRELLFLIGRQDNSDPLIQCVEFNSGREWKYNFRYRNEENLGIKTSAVQNYLLDPFAAVTKAGSFKSPIEDFNISLLHANTHVYTSIDKPKGFPGKCFKIEEVFPYDAGLIRESIPDKKAHLVFRNFPIKSEEVAKKLRFTSDGNIYLYFVTDHSGKMRVIKSIA